MTTLSWIVFVSVAGGALSVLAAAILTWFARAVAVSHLVSYAIGALLGAVFLEILPHALEHAGEASHVGTTILCGILVFFVLEKLVLWRHCHHTDCEAHEVAHDHGRSGTLILIGDTFHNFVDGVIIAAAFLENTQLGIVTAIAIIAHEIPQEVGDFVILLHSGYSRARALAFNLLSGLAMLAGGLLAYFALSEIQGSLPYLLGIAAASMIYVAMSDLIPGLHKRTDIRATVQQVLLIVLGIASIAGASALIGE